MKRTDTKNNGKRVTRPVKPSPKRAPVKRPKRESMNDVIQRGIDQRSFI